MKTYNKEWYHDYYIKHKAEKAEWARQYYLSHKEAIQKQHHEAKLWLTPEAKAYRRQYKRDHPQDKEAALRSHFKCTYGLSTEAVDNMVIVQNNLCAICRQPETSKPRLSVDHDHKGKKVRGLLCHRCNVGLGYFKDSPELLNSAIIYLQQAAKEAK